MTPPEITMALLLAHMHVVFIAITCVRRMESARHPVIMALVKREQHSADWRVQPDQGFKQKGLGWQLVFSITGT
jgi:hypothetical protein